MSANDGAGRSDEKEATTSPGSTSTGSGRLLRLALVVFLSGAVLIAPGPARSIDVTGVFSLSDPAFGTFLSFQQSGSSLSVCAPVSGGTVVPVMEGNLVDSPAGAFGLVLSHPIFNGVTAVCALNVLGEFAPDGSSFVASFDESTTCVPPPFSCNPQCVPAASGPLNGTRLSTTPAPCCGNGMLEVGEQCDNSVPGNDVCCSGTCVFAPAGSFCPGAADCMIGICDGAGACAQQQPLPAGSLCTDDGDSCTIDRCDGAGTCTHQRSNDPACTGVGCPTCARFDPAQNACVVEPAPSCHYASEPGADSFFVRRPDSPSGNRLTWKFHKGQTTVAAEFGSPATTDDYDLCLFDFSGAAPNLLLGVRVPAASVCGGKPCWKELGKPPGNSGARYRDRAATVGGLRAISLKPGADGKARVALQAKGAGLPALPAGPLPLPLHLQLRAEREACWESQFSTAQANDGVTFKAKGP